jgi:hypothetical protein
LWRAPAALAQAPCREMSRSPRHDDQVLAGEQLGAADDNEDEAQGEHYAAKQSRRPIAQPVMCEGNRRYIGAQRDERAGEHGKGEHRGCIKVGFRHPNRFQSSRHFRWGVGVDVKNLFVHRGSLVPSPPVGRVDSPWYRRRNPDLEGALWRMRGRERRGLCGRALLQCSEPPLRPSTDSPSFTYRAASHRYPALRAPQQSLRLQPP